MCYGRTICKCRIFQAECFFLLPFVGPGSMKTLDEYTNSWWKEKFHRAFYPGQLKCKDCPFQSWSYPAARLLPKHTFFPSCFSPQQQSKGMLYAFRKKVHSLSLHGSSAGGHGKCVPDLLLVPFEICCHGDVPHHSSAWAFYSSLFLAEEFCSLKSHYMCALETLRRPFLLLVLWGGFC